MISQLYRFFGPARGKGAPLAPPRLVPGLCVYAIGDIHGEIGLLDRLLDRLRRDAAPRLAEGEMVVMVFLGDLVDRGPDSRGVIDRLIRLEGDLPPGCACRFLRGNHEAAMLDFLDFPPRGAEWLGFGGRETLASYGITALAEDSGAARLAVLRERMFEVFPPEHRNFLDALEPYAVYDDYVFVHAGLRPGRKLHRQTLDDLLWIREPFLSSRRREGRTVVHGHTVTTEVTFFPDRHAPARIGIDTGAYASRRLSAIRLRGAECVVIDTSM
jgi:serine/threonine protein phosphatase 1